MDSFFLSAETAAAVAVKLSKDGIRDKDFALEMMTRRSFPVEQLTNKETRIFRLTNKINEQEISGAIARDDLISWCRMMRLTIRLALAGYQFIEEED